MFWRKMSEAEQVQARSAAGNDGLYTKPSPIRLEFSDNMMKVLDNRKGGTLLGMNGVVERSRSFSRGAQHISESSM